MKDKLIWFLIIVIPYFTVITIILVTGNITELDYTKVCYFIMWTFVWIFASSK
jgi:hypothetical protein